MTERKRMTFSDALFALKSGSRVARDGWNGKGMWIELQHPSRSSKMTLPYIFLCTADGNLVPWVASHTDLFASDWAVVPVT